MTGPDATLIASAIREQTRAILFAAQHVDPDQFRFDEELSRELERRRLEDHEQTGGETWPAEK